MSTDTKSTNQKPAVNLPPIDSQGKPTTYLTFRLLKLMFSRPSRFFTPGELAKLLSAKYSDTDLICRQLKLMDFLTESPSQQVGYRYNLNSKNFKTQASFETFLVDVELEALPVHLMLDYSPSYRSPGDPRAGRF